MELFNIKKSVSKNDATLSAELNINNRNHLIYFSTEKKYFSYLDDSYDPFLSSMIFLAMQENEDIHIKGAISKKLLINLHEFMNYWSYCIPYKYKKININADKFLKDEKHTEFVISVFSGGVDSCFTAYINRGDLFSEMKRLDAALMVHGFDISVDDNHFIGAYQRSKNILTSLDLPLIKLKTNIRKITQEYRVNWEHSHGSAIASALQVFQKQYGYALIPSSESYHESNFIWGTNPITDPMFSSRSMYIIHDSARFTRIEKIRHISNWTEACQNIRVCWEGKRKDRNCGICEKCIRTIIGFWLAGQNTPPCFDISPTIDNISKLPPFSDGQRCEMQKILSAAKDMGLKSDWLNILETKLQNK